MWTLLDKLSTTKRSLETINKISGTFNSSVLFKPDNFGSI